MHEFVINGRFLGQSMTGVQRYAYEISSAIGAEISQDDRFRGSIISPSGSQRQTVGHLTGITASPLHGHLWEQTTLPARAKGLLVNLCNSGPILRGRQITCIHGANTFVSPESYSAKFRLSQKVLLHAMGSLSVHVTTVSQASARLLHELGIVPKGKPIAVAPNGHEHALRWRPERSELSQRFTFERPFVLLIGSMSPHKNVKLITSLARELDGIGIDVAIAGGSFKVFSGSAADRDEANILRLGYVTDDDLAYLLGKALCFVFPSVIEGFGLPLVEAMAIGCPIVSSNTASMPEVCGDAAILLDPHRKEDWLQAIGRLKTDEALRHELVARGKARVTAFSWRESARTYLRLIESV